MGVPVLQGVQRHTVRPHKHCLPVTDCSYSYKYSAFTVPGRIFSAFVRHVVRLVCVPVPAMAR